MPQVGHNAYLESRIEGAAPIELVRLLYQATSSAVRDARRHLAAGETAERSRAVTRAFSIVAELTTSLDRERGGVIAEQLAQLYDYIGRRLLEANFAQADQPLAEVLGLLATLSEAWDGVAAQTRPAETAPQHAMPWGQPADPDAAAVAGHAWSF